VHSMGGISAAAGAGRGGQHTGGWALQVLQQQTLAPILYVQQASEYALMHPLLGIS
jgi:hypothetical protein